MSDDAKDDKMEQISRLTDEELRRSLDRESLPLAIRLREHRLTLERGIGPCGRTYTLYDRTDRVLEPFDSEPPFDRPARGITVAEVDQWIDLIENAEGIANPDPETIEVIEITRGMGRDAWVALSERLRRARGGQP